MYFCEKCMTMTTNELYENVTRLCKEQKMQQKDLAEKMGIAPAALSKALTGNPTLDTIRKMATALGVPIKTLFEEVEGVSGYVEYRGKIHHFNSREEFEKYTTKPKAFNLQSKK